MQEHSKPKADDDNPTQLQREIGQTSKYLMEAYDLAYENGSTHTLHEIAFCLAMINLINSYNQNQNRTQQARTSIICAFYLGGHWFLFLLLETQKF